MADVMYGKQKRFGKRTELCAQGKKDVTETESSIFRQLEKEDLQRYKAISEEVNCHGIRKAYQNKIYEEDKPNEQRREIGKKLEKTRRNPGRKELMRSKGQRIGRFLHKRISNRVNKRWHSDSELLDSMSKEASLASRKSKLVGDLHSSVKKSLNKNDSVTPNPSVHQKDLVQGCREMIYDESKDDMGLGGESGKAIKDRQMWTKNDEVCHWMNCSFPATVRDNEKRQDVCDTGEGNSNTSGVLNLLVEYFKDLNKEVREFREEKKKTREQIQHIELTVEQLLLRLEVQDLPVHSRSGHTAEGKENADTVSQGKAKHVSARNEDVCIEIETRPDIRQEIRNILADVHKKYQMQLSEHELRMKCVQEKAEYDIQKLMRTIVGNYVELSKLRGSGKELGRLMIQRKIEDGEKYTANGKELKMDTKNASSTEREEIHPKEKDERRCKPSDTGCSPQIKAEMMRNSYQFYFPRETRAECIPLVNKEKYKVRTDTHCPQKDDDHNKSSKRIDTICKKTSDTAIIEKLADSNCGYQEPRENSGNAETKTRDSSCPEGLGASYLEWKKYWCDKLSKRNSLLQASRDKVLRKGEGGRETARQEGRREGEQPEDKSQDVRFNHPEECNRNNN